MIIEIVGTGNHNKGSEMMLLTILNKLKDERLKFTAEPNTEFFDYPFYSRLGIFPKLWERKKTVNIKFIGKLIPKKIRESFGIILENEIDVIIDSSGFAYGDQWGLAPTKKMAIKSANWKKNKKKIILMPQAFGPFINRQHINYMKKIIQNVDLIYARDQFSYDELKKVYSGSENIKIAPDFTKSLKPILPKYFNASVHQVCIVPNQRVKDKRYDSEHYEEYLASIIKILLIKGVSPYFLIQGGIEDQLIAEKINLLLKEDRIDLILESDPQKIKGVISNSVALIGSRYHSLASAFYSNIPALGIGWNHKYYYLFNDFNYLDGLLELENNNEELISMIDLILDIEYRGKLKLDFEKRNQLIDILNNKMFDEIRKNIYL